MQKEEGLFPVPPDWVPRFKVLATEYRAHFEVEDYNSPQPDNGTLSFSYIISVKWLDAFTKYIGYPAILDNEERAETTQVEPGRVNEDLVESGESQMVPEGNEHDFLNVHIKDNLAFNEHYKIIEKKAWDFIQSQFSDAIEIKRTNYINEEGTLKTEVYPQEVKQLPLFPFLTSESLISSFSGWKQIKVIFFDAMIARDIDCGKLKQLDPHTVRVPGHYTIKQFKQVLSGRKELMKDELSYTSSLERSGHLQLWTLEQTPQEFFEYIYEKTNSSTTYTYNIKMKGVFLDRDEDIGIKSLGIFGEHDVLLAEESCQSSSTSQRTFVLSVTGIESSQKDDSNGYYTTYPNSDNQERMDDDRSDQNQSGNYGKCEYCTRYKTLTCPCICKKVEYCSESCKIKDKHYHEPNCERAGEEEKSQLTGYTAGSRKGLTGLENLGNTCFMNSGIQCLSNTIELTEFFLSDEYEKEINEENAIGTQGKLVRSFANMMKNLWYGTSGHYRPYSFKSTLGRANPMFSGYQQHDSQELICFILDKLHEDLNRIKKKPIVDGIEKEENETDIETARRAWIAYKRRNDSKVTDLMFGQLRSKLTCPTCGNTSITFDPFNFVTLPIPKPFRKEINVFMIRFNFNKPTLSYKFVFTNPALTVADLKGVLEEKFEVPKKNILVGKLSFKVRGEILQDSLLLKDFCKMLKKSSTWDAFALEVSDEELALMGDAENCISAFATFNKNAASHSWWDSKKPVFSIRPFFFRKSTTSIQIYRRIYEFLAINLKLNETCELAQPVSDEDLVKLFSSEDLPFKIILKKKLSDSDSYWSSKSKEDGVEIDIKDEKETLGEQLDLESTHKVDGKYVCEMEVLFPSSTDLPLSNLSTSDPLEREKEESSSDKLNLATCFTAFEQPEVLDEMNTWYCRKCKDHVRAKKELRLFKVPDILVIQMKRFKERETTIRGYYKDYHTSVGSKISTKIDFPLEGLNLDQFVMSKESIDEDYKITFDEIYGEPKTAKPQEETKAESPESPEMSELQDVTVEPVEEKKKAPKPEPAEAKLEATEAKSEPAEAKSKRNLTYDLYAVSNHYGSMNFGHYTAYVRNPFDKCWYDCDDSRVSEVSPAHVVSEAAYVLFYRRRKDA